MPSDALIRNRLDVSFENLRHTALRMAATRELIPGVTGGVFERRQWKAKTDEGDDAEQGCDAQLLALEAAAGLGLTRHAEDQLTAAAELAAQPAEEVGAVAPEGGPLRADLVAGLIVDVADYPQPGIVFKDITPVLADHDALVAVVGGLATAGRDASPRERS